MKSRLLITSIAGVAVLIGGGVIAHHAYEQNVSTDFKRIAVAMVDAHNSQADWDSYMHDARLAVKTDKDRELLDAIENGVALLYKAKADSDAGASLDEVMGELKEANRLGNSARAQLGLSPVPFPETRTK